MEWGRHSFGYSRVSGLEYLHPHNGNEIARNMIKHFSILLPITELRSNDIVITQYLTIFQMSELLSGAA